MSNQGYSLVEILTVIVIMLVLTGIAFISYSNIGVENKINLNKGVEKKIKEAAAAYCSNPDNNCVDAMTIQVGILKTEGLLDGELKDYVDNLDVSDCATVLVNSVGTEGFNFEYTFNIDDPLVTQPCP